jgi:hypothetical protein
LTKLMEFKELEQLFGIKLEVYIQESIFIFSS